MSGFLKRILKGEVGQGIYEPTDDFDIGDMIPIDGVHQQCNSILADAMRRICGDYMENKYEIIPPELGEDIDELTERVLTNERFMRMLNKTISDEYHAMYGESNEGDLEINFPPLDIPEEPKRDMSRVDENGREIINMEYFDI